MTHEFAKMVCRHRLRWYFKSDDTPTCTCSFLKTCSIDIKRCDKLPEREEEEVEDFFD